MRANESMMHTAVAPRPDRSACNTAMRLMVQAGRVAPAKRVTQVEPMSPVIEAFRSFGRRESGRTQLELYPQPSAAASAASAS